MLHKISTWLLLKRLSWEERVMLGAFAIFSFVYPFGILLLSFGWMPFGMEWMSSLLLALMGVTAWAWLGVNFGTWGAVAGVAIFLAGIGIEWFGVETGTPFGPYRYTEVLAPILPNGVPTSIGSAWQMIVVSGLATAAWLLRGRLGAGSIWLVSAVGAALAVGLDFLLEPVAFHVKRYWEWLGDGGGYYGVPWSNFATWFVAVLVLNMLVSLRIDWRGKTKWAWVPVALYTMNVIMFGIVGLAHGFWWSGVIGVGLSVVLYLVGRPTLRIMGLRL